MKREYTTEEIIKRLKTALLYDEKMMDSKDLVINDVLTMLKANENSQI